MTVDLHKLSNNSLNLAISSRGAEMQYLRTSSGADLLWNGHPDFWTGRAPILFPIVGRAVDDIVAIGDHQATMSQHGFARRSMFELDEHTGTMCRHRLRDSRETMSVYPFRFDLQITHEIVQNKLRVTARVRNESDNPMPFGIGFHPAFRWPLPGAESDPHYVRLASRGTPEQRLLEGGLLSTARIQGPFTDGSLEINDISFQDGALVFPNGSDSLNYGPPGRPGLAFAFNNLPDLALWRPLGAPFLCIEPWHGTASHVGDGPQIADRPNSISLLPQATAEFGYSVTVTT